MRTNDLSNYQVQFLIIFLVVLISISCSRIPSYSEGADLEETIDLQRTWLAQLSTQVLQQEQVNASQWEAISYLSTQMPYALGGFTPVPFDITVTPTPYNLDDHGKEPTFTPTPFASIDIEYPPGMRTGIHEIDMVIDAILSHNVDTRLELVRYLRTACTTADGLGGPPKCKPGEADGTMVDAFPVSSGEGYDVRPDEIQTLFDFTVRGLFAIYVVPEDAHHADYWPAGDYGVVFTSEEGDYPHVVTVLVEEGRIVRLDFGFEWPPFEMVWGKSDTFILPPIR